MLARVLLPLAMAFGAATGNADLRQADHLALLDTLTHPLGLDTFLQTVYLNRPQVFKGSGVVHPSLLRGDDWLRQLAMPDEFLKQEKALLQNPAVVTVRDAKGQRVGNMTRTEVETGLRFGYSYVLAREAMTDIPPSDIEEALQTVFRTARRMLTCQVQVLKLSILTPTLTVSDNGVIAQRQSTISGEHGTLHLGCAAGADVFVVQAIGTKTWQLCVPSPYFGGDGSEILSDAQQSQLFEAQIERSEGCTSFSMNDLSGMRCRSVTLMPGDVLYVPKSVVHVAKTSNSTSTSPVSSAHITYSLTRRDATFRDVLDRVCRRSSLGHLQDACAAVANYVTTNVMPAPAGLGWYNLAAPSPSAISQSAGLVEGACDAWAQLLHSSEIVDGTMRHILTETTLQEVSLRDVEALMLRLLNCDDSDIDSIRNVLASQPSHAAEMHRYRRDAAYTPPCASQSPACITSGCAATSCDDGCNGDGVGCATVALCSGNRGCFLGVCCGGGGCNNCGICGSWCTRGCDTRSCSSVQCPAGSRGQTTNIETTRCIKCERGKFQPLATRSNQCQSCPVRQFQDAEGQTGCKSCSASGALCPAGRYQTTCGGASPGTCQQCPVNQFQPVANVRVTSCRSCGTCGRGKKYSCDPTKGLVCTNCPSGEYQDSPNHRGECKAQATCAPGQLLAGATSQTRGSCTACPSNTFRAENAHRFSSCTAQPECGSGQYLSGASPIRQGQCLACPNGQFQPLQGPHRATTCAVCSTEGTACRSGQRQSGCGGASPGRCVGCTVGSYQPAQQHRFSSCTPCVTCSPGTGYGGCTVTSGPGSCTSCASGQYQDASSHREPCKTCSSANACLLGQELTGCGGNGGRLAGTCQACSSGKYRSSPAQATCQTCPPCDAGKERINCGGASPGQCRGKICIAPSPINNGAVAVDDDGRFPSTATYKCNPGYTLEGQSRLECSASTLRYAGAVPRCVPVSCGDVTTVNGQAVYSGKTFGSTARIDCSLGYQPAEVQAVQCRTDGTWSNGGSLECNPMACSAPAAIANGKVVVVDGGFFPSQARYTCNPGYAFSDGSIAQDVSCQAAEWSSGAQTLQYGPIPECTPLRCTAPAVDGASARLSNNGFFPSTATYTCRRGYRQTDGDATRQCQPDGTFTGKDIVCEGVQCNIRVPDDSTVSSPTVRFPDAVSFSCNRGYELDGQPSIQCGADGTLSDTEPMCTACPADTFKPSASGTEVCQTCGVHSTTDGSTAQSACQCVAGYSLSSNACAPCPVDTSKAGVGNGPCRPCEAGYNTRSRTGATTCTGVACDDPPNIPYSQTTVTNNNRFPSTLTVVCENGFRLAGSDDGSRSCLESGSWPSNVPRCENICGDGLAVAGEECDDGNVESGDGCDSTCQLESGFYCLDGGDGSDCQLCGFTAVPSDGKSGCASETENLQSWLSANGGARGVDNPHCGQATIAATPGSIEGPQGCQVRNFNFEVTFAEGGSARAAAAFQTRDTNAPQITQLPTKSSYNCASIPDVNSVVVKDDCSSTDSISVTAQESTTDETCASRYTLTQSWIATDACGNVAEISKTFGVTDDEAPTIESPPQDLVLECDGTAQQQQVDRWLAGNGGAVATDACARSLVWTHNFDSIKDQLISNRASQVQVTFTADDGCGNNVSTTATIHRRDTVEPVIDGLSFDSLTVDETCPMVMPPTVNITAFDACNGPIDVDYSETYTKDTVCSQVLVRTWTATDANGQSTSKQQTVNVDDVDGPRVTQLPASVELTCSASSMSALDDIVGQYGSVVVTDDCSRNDQIALESTRGLFTPACDAGIPGTYPYTVTATDECGQSTTSAAVVTIVDANSPVWPETLAPSLSAECDIIPDTSAIAMDNCFGAINGTFSDNVIPGYCDGQYTIERTHSATDPCGQRATFVQVIDVTDTGSPTISAPSIVYSVECDGAGNRVDLNSWKTNQAFSTAIDSCSAAALSSSFGERQDGCSATYSVSATLSAADACNNTAEQEVEFEAIDTIGPLSSQTPPSIELTCSEPIPPAAQQLTARDTCDQDDYTASLQEVRLEGRCADEYVLQRRWIAVDLCGNEGISIQNVSIRDVTPPELATGAQDLLIECSIGDHETDIQAWLDGHGGAVATDDCGGELNWQHNGSALVSGSYVNCDSNVEHLVSFEAYDACGNLVVTHATVKLVDSSPPSITAVPQDSVIECNSDQNAAFQAWLDTAGGGEAVDLCSQAVRTTRSVFNQVECANTFQAEVDFTFTDECGLSSSANATFATVDTTIPELELRGPAVQTTEAGFDWQDPGISSAFDTCANDNLAGRLLVFDTPNIMRPQTYNVKYSVEDDCGNRAEKQRTVQVQDTLPPRFMDDGAMPLWIRQNAVIIAPPMPSATDFVTQVSDEDISLQPTAWEDISQTSGMFVLGAAATDEAGNVGTTPLYFANVLPAISDATKRREAANEVTMEFSTALSHRLTNTYRPGAVVGFSMGAMFHIPDIATAEDVARAAREAGLSVYSKPRCVNTDVNAELMVCRIDLATASEAAVTILSQVTGVVATDRRASAVSNYRLIQRRDAGQTIDDAQRMLRRRGATSASLVSCDSQLCEFDVRRSEVNFAAGVTLPHPFTVVNIDGRSSSVNSEVSMLDAVLAAGLLPLWYEFSDESKQGQFAIADVVQADHLQAALASSSLSVTSTAVTLELAFDMTLAADQAQSDLRQILFDHGIIPSSITAQTNNQFSISTHTAVHTSELQALMDIDAVLFAGNLRGAPPQPSLEDEWPFITPLTAAGETNATAAEQRAMRLLSDEDPVVVSCTVNAAGSAVECWVGSVKPLQPRTKALLADAFTVGQHTDETIATALEDAVGGWIGSQLSGATLGFNLETETTVSSTVNGGQRAAAYSIHISLQPQSTTVDGRQQYSTILNYDIGQEAAVRAAVADQLGSTLIQVETSSNESLSMITSAPPSPTLAATLSTTVGSTVVVSRVAMRNATLLPSDGAFFLRQVIASRFVEVRVEDSIFTTANENTIRASSWTPATTSPSANSAKSNGRATVVGAAVGGCIALLVLVVIAVAVRRRQRGSSKSMETTGMPNSAGAHPLAMVNPLYNQRSDEHDDHLYDEPRHGMNGDGFYEEVGMETDAQPSYDQPSFFTHNDQGGYDINRDGEAVEGIYSSVNTTQDGKVPYTDISGYLDVEGDEDDGYMIPHDDDVTFEEPGYVDVGESTGRIATNPTYDAFNGEFEDDYDA